MTAQPRDAKTVLDMHPRVEEDNHGQWFCTGCDEEVRSVRELVFGVTPEATLVAHQALMLAAEGYPVTAAGLAQVKAAAWDEGYLDALRDMTSNSPVGGPNPYRTEGEGRG